MKTFALLSGGKDSFLASTIAMEQGFDVDLSLTVMASEHSFMYHFPNHEMAGKVSELLGIPNLRVEEGRVAAAISDLSKRGYSAMVTGAIASEYQKTRLEEMCTENNIVCYAPLWRKNQRRILEELQNRAIRAIVVSVSADGLGPDYLGRFIDDSFIEDIAKKSRKYGINMAGEGGEYESLVIGWDNRCIVIEESEKRWTGSEGIMTIKKAELRPTSSV
ncbi:MAG TPA: diphthine--ammonia ligase [Thermoplasmataceae archaeon]|nr:diphthine--ammonia ligase [Thermoplasmatales archaeon AK]HLH86024.1 diphthine--ammonia ligase [Thermoplasmataceae archaeon]